MGQEFHPETPRGDPVSQGGRGKQIDADKTIFYLLSPADGGLPLNQGFLELTAMP